MNPGDPMYSLRSLCFTSAALLITSPLEIARAGAADDPFLALCSSHAVPLPVPKEPEWQDALMIQHVVAAHLSRLYPEGKPYVTYDGKSVAARFRFESSLFGGNDNNAEAGARAEVNRLVAILFPEDAPKLDVKVRFYTRLDTVTLISDGDLKPQYLKNGKLDMGLIWKTIINSFGKTRDLEIDSASIKTEGDAWSANTNYSVVSLKSGFVVRQQVVVRLIRPQPRKDLHRDELTLETVVKMQRRRASATEWETAEVEIGASTSMRNGELFKKIDHFPIHEGIVRELQK